MAADREEQLDPRSLDEIDAAECWKLLKTQQVGRVAVIVGHYPLVFPVNYVVEGRSLLFRTGAGTKLWATSRSNVSFEVDDVDLLHRTGWSVLVRGMAREIVPQQIRSSDAEGQTQPPEPWAPGTREHLIRIAPDSISGRRIRPAEFPPATDAHGYV